MVEKNCKTLYRSNDPCIVGVCGGIAEYFSIDPSVVRIVTVVLAILSGGLAAVAYLVLWLVLPQRPAEAAGPVEVDPQTARSEVYGQVVYGNPPQASQATQPMNAQPTQTSASGEYCPPPPNSYAAPANQPGDNSGMRAGLVVGLILAAAGLLVLAENFIPMVPLKKIIPSLWPIIFILWGICRMVIPGKKGKRVEVFSGGLTLFAFGLTALLCTIDVIRPYYGEFFSQIWPLAIVWAGLAIIGATLKSQAFVLLNALLFVGACVILIMMYSEPGTIHLLYMLPIGHMPPHQLFVGM